MKTVLSTQSPSQLETECLVVGVLDHGDKQNPQPEPLTGDTAIGEAGRELIASKEITGKAFETVLLHRPQGLPAKRILFVGGGKAGKFSPAELRKLAGAGVRFLKGKNIKSLAVLAPPAGSMPGAAPADAVRAIIESACVADFDPDYYRSDRQDQAVQELRSRSKKDADTAGLQRAMEEGRIIGESQNFTRDLVNEPSNRMTPTILAERARKMCDEVGLPCEIYGPDRIKELKMGAFWSVAQGSDEEPRLIVMRYEPASRARRLRCSAWWARALPLTPAASASSPPTAWRR